MDSLWKQTVIVRTQKNMDGWMMDGWMGGWRDGGRDGWIERGRDKWRDGWSNSKCTVKVLHLFSIWLFWWKAASAISSKLPNVMHVQIFYSGDPFNIVCLKIVNISEKIFLSNILHRNKYKAHFKYFSEKLNHLKKKYFC